MLIREANEKDILDVLKLLSSMDDEIDMDISKALDTLKKLSEYPYYKVLVVEENEKIIGTLSLIIIDNLGHKGAKLAVAESVIVAKEQRGKGIGKFMMNHAMGLAKKHNCYKLMLSSNMKRVPAHEFYKKLGFEHHGISFAVEVRYD